MTVDDLTPQEIAAALAARRELGPDYEHEIAAALADRMERRIDAEVAARTGADQKSGPSPRDGRGALLGRAGHAGTGGAGGSAGAGDRHDVEIADSVTARWTALGSLAAGTIVTVSSSGNAYNPSVVGATWFGIIMINLAVGLGRRRRRRG
ncbi:hypothetical protein GCM10009839_16790 [Catenulispora yoronensis]|uniref:DUF1707 domain-containing protein n=1 Tax=Catenulispora yoronensis TaxID=450799 RepID=A0ABN2TTW1_9ACTN